MDERSGIYDDVLNESIFRIGKVTGVEGRSVKIEVDKGKNHSNLIFKGESIQNISVGGYVKISKGFIDIIGKVEGESIKENRAKNDTYKNNDDNFHRILTVSLLGFIDANKFERGIKELPLIENQCFLLTQNEFRKIHKFFDPGKDTPIRIGSLSLEKGQSIDLGINSLFASHIGIFGNTGSGKSYTLSKLYHEFFKLHVDNDDFIEKADFVFIDFNGEYINDNAIIEKKFKNTFNLSTRKTQGAEKLPILKDSIADSAFWSIFLEATEKTQSPFLARALNDTYIREKLDSEDDFKSFLIETIHSATTQNDKSIEKSVITDLLAEVAKYLGDAADNIWDTFYYFQNNLKFHGNNQTYILEGWFANNDPNQFEVLIRNNFANVKYNESDISEVKKIGLTIILKYFSEIVRGFSNKEHLSPVIKRLEKRINDIEKVITVDEEIDSSKNITVISLNDVNVTIKKVIPLLYCKQIYEAKKQSGRANSYLNIVVDEAHNIFSDISSRESEQWKDYRLETFEEIIKEGRKFGVFMTVASQRPADISATILSQLHNYFLHRIINNKDIQAIEKTISYLDKVSFEYLPILPTGTCILAGLSAHVPVLLDVSSIDKKYEPDNKTLNILDLWKDDH